MNADINIRNDDESLRQRFNAIRSKHGLTQREMLDRLVEFADNNPDQLQREVLTTERNRKNRETNRGR